MRARLRKIWLCTIPVVALVSVVPAVRATAQEPNPEAVFGVSLAPESDSAATGTCNEFTATLVVDGPSAGFTVDVEQTLQGATNEPEETRELAFCDPQDPSGPNPTGQGATFGDVAGSNPAQTPGQAGRNTTVHAEVGPTDENGAVTFGISMSPTTAGGDVTVTVWFDRTDEDIRGEGDPTASSTKTWIAQQASALVVDAAPEAAARPQGGSHQVTVTVTNGGNPVQGTTPSDWVAPDATGRPAGDVADAGAGASPNFVPGNGNSGWSCTPTDAEGVSTCTYQDAPGSGPGTDTVVFFVETSGDPDLPDGTDPQDAVQVTWFTAGGGQEPGPPEARNVRLCHGDDPTEVCETGGRTRAVGEEHEVAALVTDRQGRSVFGIPVEFRESGPGGLLPDGLSSFVGITDRDGVARAVLTSDTPGASSVVAEISPPGIPGGFRGPGAADDECEQSARPDGAPAGNCVSQTLEVTWEPLPVCDDGADNDGDGLADDADPACRRDGAVSELPLHHTRAITLRFDDLTGDKDDPLLLSGRVKLVDPDEVFPDCITQEVVRIKRLRDGEWEWVAETTTDVRGRYKVRAPDRTGDYRAIVRRSELDVGGVLHACRRAERVKPHRHA